MTENGSAAGRKAAVSQSPGKALAVEGRPAFLVHDPQPQAVDEHWT